MIKYYGMFYLIQSHKGIIVINASLKLKIAQRSIYGFIGGGKLDVGEDSGSNGLWERSKKKGRMVEWKNGWDW